MDNNIDAYFNSSSPTFLANKMFNSRHETKELFTNQTNTFVAYETNKRSACQ